MKSSRSDGPGAPGLTGLGQLELTGVAAAAYLHTALQATRMARAFSQSGGDAPSVARSMIDRQRALLALVARVSTSAMEHPSVGASDKASLAAITRAATSVRFLVERLRNCLESSSPAADEAYRVADAAAEAAVLAVTSAPTSSTP